MKILEYEYFENQKNSKMKINKIQLGNTSLMIGDSGAGKSSCLNSLFNIASFAINQNAPAFQGNWKMTFTQRKVKYCWEIEIAPIDNMNIDFRTNIVKKEKLSYFDQDNNIQVLFSRNPESITIGNNKLANMNESQSAIIMLKNEEKINDVFQGFHAFLRRYFDKNTIGHSEKIDIITMDIVEDINKQINRQNLIGNEFGLSLYIYFISVHFPDIYKQIKEFYVEYFPFIKNMEVSIQPAGSMPLPNGNFVSSMRPELLFYEKGVDYPLTFHQLSSGMKKVLLMITDYLFIPDGGIYIVDEYENSLGVSVIGFFPELINLINRDIQVIITTHHPYLINNIEMKNWIVFNRNGTQINSISGDDVVQRYGKSRHEAFTKLLNDPFFNRSLEE